MLKDPYVTVLEADEFNASVQWVALADDEKLTALKWGRVFLDGKYACPSIQESDSRYDDFVNARKVANARLGDYQVQGKLFQVSDTNDATITAKAVKAGSVSISKKFATGEYSINQKDLFPDVTAILSPYCTTFSSMFNQVPIIRS